MLVGWLLLTPAAPLACTPEAFRLAIDIGHTAEAPGAISARGRGEYAFNTDIAHAIVAALRAAGFTRTALLEDYATITSLGDRTETSARLGADLFMSVHHDSVQERFLQRGVLDGEVRTFSRHAQGFSLFVRGTGPWAPASLDFATRLGAALTARHFVPSPHHAEDVDGERRQWLDPVNGIYRWDGLYVLRHNTAPAILVEIGVIKHPEEELRLRDPATHSEVAAAVVEALRGYCADG